MTKQDYELLAAALRDAYPLTTARPADLVPMQVQWGVGVHAIAHALAGQNPRFNRVRFVLACGVQS